MTNQDYILNWLQNYNQRYRNGNLYSDTNTLYSYGSFIIGLKVEGCVLYTTNYASSTTSCHLGLLKKNLENLYAVAFPCSILKSIKDGKSVEKEDLLEPIYKEVLSARKIKPSLWKDRPYYKEDFPTYIARLKRMVEGLTTVANNLNISVYSESSDLLEQLEIAELRFQRIIYGLIPKSAHKLCTVPQPVDLQAEITLC